MQVEATAPLVSAAVVAHPGWCDPSRCLGIDGDVEHRSAVVVVRTAAARLVLGWVRVDEGGEGGGGGQPGVPELRIDVSYEAPGVRAQLFLTPGEVRELGQELFRCCWRERCGRALVVRRAVVVGS